MSDESRLNQNSLKTYAVNPSTFFDDGLMLSYWDHDTALGATEQLYTARGAQGFGTRKDITSFGVNPANDEDIILLLYE